MQRKRGYVSVVIPCYNHGAYIIQTLQSVLGQSCSNYEILIVNDGSNDLHTKKVLDEIDHPKVSVLHKENGHVSSARNHGIRHSSGEYILTLDADDYFEPTFLEKALQVMENQPETGVVTCYAYTFNHKGITGTSHPKGGGVESFLASNNCWASALFRYRCWEDAGGFNETMRNGYEDWDFWLSVTTSGWKVYSIPEYLYWYRDTPNSMVKDSTDHSPELIRLLVTRHKEVYRDHVVEVMYKKELNLQLMARTKDTLTYRLGDFLLFPAKYILARFKKNIPMQTGM